VNEVGERDSVGCGDVEWAHDEVEKSLFDGGEDLVRCVGVGVAVEFG